ncbi:hypothetical protein BGZ83_011382 [Gryganskiella cystojenkinii]|nr:hypothetical protein BGZ83_011382 [Gryganskiella cystojenkinii]
MSIIFTRELRISNVFLRKLRICIAILSFISGIILTAWYGYVLYLESNSSPTLSKSAICEIIIIIVIFLTYTYAVRSKTS